MTNYINTPISESRTLEAIKSSLEVIESNTVDAKQLKETLESIERLLTDLLAAVNEGVGMFEEFQKEEKNR